jgi:hypothetical protein
MCHALNKASMVLIKENEAMRTKIWCSRKFPAVIQLRIADCPIKIRRF